MTLIRDSFKQKWNARSGKNLLAKCAFCRDAIDHLAFTKGKTLCDTCLCPRGICGDGSRAGYIRELIEAHGEQRSIGNLPLADRNHMLRLFAESFKAALAVKRARQVRPKEAA